MVNRKLTYHPGNREAGAVSKINSPTGDSAFCGRGLGGKGNRSASLLSGSLATTLVE